VQLNACVLSSPIAGVVGGEAALLDLHEVAPTVRLCTIDVGEAVDGGKLSAGDDLAGSARNVRVGGEGGDGASEAQAQRPRPPRRAC
jgi:hypothetical protein